jgi:hypothetical protein
MSVKLILLQSGENIVSEIKEGFFQDKLVCYILENPCTIFVNETYESFDEKKDGTVKENKASISLRRWPYLISMSSGDITTIEVSPNSIVTVLEPVESLKKMYETQVLGITRNENDQTDAFSEQSDSDKSD